MANRTTKRKRRLERARQSGLPPAIPMQHRRGLSLRDRVFIRDDYTCVYCGDRGTTLDHVVPKSKGGGNTMKNLACCCERCNQAKADMPVARFRVLLLLSAAVA